MRILLDENLSRRIRSLLPEHRVATVAYQNWRGVKNGALLALAEASGFDVFLTADQNMPFQQSVQGRKLAVVVLNTNQFKVHDARIAAIQLAIRNCSPGTITFVDLGAVSQIKSPSE